MIGSMQPISPNEKGGSVIVRAVESSQIQARGASRAAAESFDPMSTPNELEAVLIEQDQLGQCAEEISRHAGQLVDRRYIARQVKCIFKSYRLSTANCPPMAAWLHGCNYLVCHPAHGGYCKALPLSDLRPCVLLTANSFFLLIVLGLS
jgi:hypothetical protein